MTDDNLDFYLGNFRGMLEELVALSPIDKIKREFYPHALAKIEFFEKSYPDKDNQAQFIAVLNEELIETRRQLKEFQSSEQLAFLEEVQKALNLKFKLMSKKIDHVSSESLIILLEYLGVLDFLKKDLNQKQIAALLAFVLDRSETNLRKAVSGVTGPPRENNVKNESALSMVKFIAEKIEVDTLIKLVEEDLEKLRQSKAKKG